MPRVSAEHLDARRQQILDGARACFARHGFHQTTMVEICAEARVSAGAVYRYFPSKEAIIATLCEQGLQQSVALMASAQARDSFAAAMDDLIDTFVAALDSPSGDGGCGEGASGLDLELWAEASRNPAIRELSRRVLSGLRAPVAAIVRLGQARGELDPALEPESVAAVALAFFYGLLLQKVIDPQLDIAGAMQALRSLFGCPPNAPPAEPARPAANR